MEPREYVLDCLSGRKLFPIPGVGFHPTDVQLLGYYLLWKATKKEFPVELIAEVDVYKFAPWELAGIWEKYLFTLLSFIFISLNYSILFY